jgi:hypothetical protein
VETESLKLAFQTPLVDQGSTALQQLHRHQAREGYGLSIGRKPDPGRRMAVEIIDHDISVQRHRASLTDAMPAREADVRTSWNR